MMPRRDGQELFTRALDLADGLVEDPNSEDERALDAAFPDWTWFERVVHGHEGWSR
jgi:hypothetical protein